MTERQEGRGWCDWCEAIRPSVWECDCGLHLCGDCGDAHACGKDDPPTAEMIERREKAERDDA